MPLRGLQAIRPAVVTPRIRGLRGLMGFGQKRQILVRGVERSVGRIGCIGQVFRIVVRRNGNGGHFTVEAETHQPASDDQIASLSAKLLDALTVEMGDVVREATTESRDQLTLRVLQPGTFPKHPVTG